LVGGTSFKKQTLSLSAARNFFSGWGPVDTSRFKSIKPKLQYLIGATYRFQHKQLKININSDYLHEELRDPGALTLANLYEKALDGYHFTSRWNNRLNLMNVYHDNFVMNLEAGYSYFKKRKITYLNDLVQLMKTEASPDLHDTTSFHMYSARGFISNITGRKFEYQAGFDLSYETAFGKRTGGHRQISDAAGFMNFILRPAKSFSFQPGVRIMHNSHYKAPLVYGLSVKINPAPFTIRANYARGFRAPSLRQLYLHFKDSNHEILGNEDLKAETADNINLSVNYDQTKDSHAWGAEFNLFYNGIKNAIQLAVSLQQPGWGKYFNVDNTLYKTKGAEVNIYYRNSAGFSFNAGIVTTGRVLLNDPDRFSWSNDITASFSHRLNSSGIQMAIYYKYTDAFLEFAGNFDTEGNMDGIAQEFIEDYHTLDATVTKNLMKNRLKFSGGIKNIFDVTMVNSFGNLNIHGNMDAGATRGYGRTFFINLLFTLEKTKQE
jgi:outer membrane receptor for ferrienterochelin and colicins